ncbi:hypothetical protein ACI2K4_04730 [Micromonospora sp. NPDC050397]
MKRRSVRNDPISTSERDRGAVRTVFVDLERAVPATETKPAEPRPASE